MTADTLPDEPVGTAKRMKAAEITRLTTKFPGLGEDLFVHEHDYNQAINSRYALRLSLSDAIGRAERAEKDAGRYQWLRGYHTAINTTNSPWCIEYTDVEKNETCPIYEDDLDKALDAAIAARALLKI